MLCGGSCCHCYHCSEARPLFCLHIFKPFKLSYLSNAYTNSLASWGMAAPSPSSLPQEGFIEFSWEGFPNLNSLQDPEGLPEVF